MVWTILWPVCAVKAQDLMRISVYGSENTKKSMADMDMEMSDELVFSV